MSKLAWPGAFALVIIVSFFVFRPQYESLLQRIQTIDHGGVSLAEHVENLEINISVTSAAELEKARDELAEKARSILGIHPIGLSYFVRSATCSLWNAQALETDGHKDYVFEIKENGWGEIYAVDNDSTRQNFGGQGYQIVHHDRGRFLLMAFDTYVERCEPVQGAQVVSKDW